jgi:hypothetical protein
VTTNQAERPTATPPASDGRLARAWIAVVLIPAFFVVAFALGYVLYDLLGYKPEDNNAPLWVDVVAAVVVLAVALAPCVGAGMYGRRAAHDGDRRGRVPLAIGALAGLGLTVLTVVTTVADAID